MSVVTIPPTLRWKELEMVVRALVSPMLAIVVFMIVASLRADVVTIPNGSFESPELDFVSPYATSQIDSWLKAPPPEWWIDEGYSADQWRDSAGVFLDVPFAPIENIHERQAAFMFSPPGYELFQELDAEFEVGRTYQLTVAVEGGGYGMQLGVPMEIRLYYQNWEGNRVTVGATEVQNTNATGAMSHFTDYQLEIPAVTVDDPWANRNIGIQLVSTATFANTGGFWNIDHVRLTSVPEPGALTLLTVGLGFLGWLGRKRWRAK